MALMEIQELGCHALAIVQAAAYIRHSEWKLQRYINEYRQWRGLLLEEYLDLIQRSDDYNRTAYATWKMSYNELGPQAKALVHLCSFLHYEGIYEWIFASATLLSISFQPDEGFEDLGREALERLKDFLHPLTNSGKWSPHLFHRVIKELQSYSLLQFDSRNESYSMHPLVHEWAKNQTPDMPTTRTCVLWLFAMSIQPYLEDRIIIRQALPHLLAL